MRENKNGLGVMGYTIQCICFTDMKQAVRVATQYAPPLSSPRGRPSASRAAEKTQLSSSFPRPIRPHGHRCTCLTR